MTPDEYRAAADCACHRADVRIDTWEFDGNALRLVVSSELGQHTFASVGLRGRFTPQTFEALIYRTVLDWT